MHVRRYSCSVVYKSRYYVGHWFSPETGPKKKVNLNHRATAEAVAAPKTKRDRVAELHYITRGARNVKNANFEVS